MAREIAVSGAVGLCDGFEQGLWGLNFLSEYLVKIIKFVG